jgi:hypothetical protein
MIRAVQKLQSQPYAATLFAYTSHATFCVTTAPSYSEQEGHTAVCIGWRCCDKQFRLSLEESLRGRATSHKHACEERDFLVKVNSLIQGLLWQKEHREKLYCLGH